MDISIPKYYTHLSLFLFAIGLVLKRSFLKTAFLLNSILVGVMGNLVFIQKIEDWVVEYNMPVKQLSMVNFVMHTLPMFLSFVVLFGCPPEKGMTSTYLVFLSGMFFLWAAIPYQGESMSQKVFRSYGMTLSILTVITTLITIGTCKSVEYMRG